MLAVLLILVGTWTTTTPASARSRMVAYGYIPITATGTITALGGLCLDAKNASHADGTPVQLYACNGTLAQQWSLREKDASVRVLGACLTLAGDHLQRGVKVELDACAPLERRSQQWYYVSAPASHLFNGLSGLCLDIPAGKAVERVQLQIYDCNWSDAQRWTVPR